MDGGWGVLSFPREELIINLNLFPVSKIVNYCRYKSVAIETERNHQQKSLKQFFCLFSAIDKCPTNERNSFVVLQLNWEEKRQIMERRLKIAAKTETGEREEERKT